MTCPGTAARWPEILLIVGAGVVSAFQVGKAPAALTAIQADLGLDLATASWLLSAFALIGAAAGIVIGVAVDHLGARRLAVGGLVLQGLCSLLGAAAEDAPLLLASRVGEGFGFLAVTVAAPTLIVAVARPQDQSRAMAIWGTFMPVGMTLVMLGAPMLPLLGWRGYWLVNAGLLLAYAPLLFRSTRRLPASAASGRSLASDVGRTLGTGAPWLLALLMAAFGAAYFAVIGFLPAILSQRWDVSAETGAVLSAIVVAVNAVGNLGCGWLLSRGIRRSHILLMGFGTMAVCGLGVLGGALPAVTIYILALVFSGVGGVVPVALLEAAPRAAPDSELVGASIGFAMQGNNVGLVIGPAVAGAVAAAAGWPAVSIGVAALTLAAGLLGMISMTRAMDRGTSPS